MATASNNNTSDNLENETYFREKYEFLIAVLPDANPLYLREKCEEYYEDDREFQNFIRRSLKKKKYPRKKDYERELEFSKQKEFFKSNFTVEEFLKIIPNPEEYFSEKNYNRMNKIKYFSNEDIQYAITFLKEYFPHLYLKHITSTFRDNSYDLIKTVESLKNCNAQLKMNRKTRSLHLNDNEEISVNLILIQEIAYIKRRNDILSYVENKKMEKQRTIEEPRILNLLQTCECCFNEEDNLENETYFREKYEFLIAVLPDANPLYLREKCEEYYEDDREFQNFIRRSLKKKKYPRKKDYERELEFSKQKEFFKSNFTVEEFLKIIPNPEEYFSEKNYNRMNKIKYFSNEDIQYAITFLKEYFPHLYLKHITSTFRDNSYDLIKTVESLKNCNAQLKMNRKTRSLHLNDNEEISVNLILIQEIAYIKRRNDILSYVENKKMEKQRAIEEARILNLLQTCECCFNEEVLPTEIISCDSGHKFCLFCMKKGCELMLEQGKQEFPCLANCDKYFNFWHLETVLHPNVFLNISKSKQLNEIKASKIENLECCPHCYFAAIVPPEITVFICLNPECSKETCRLCRQPSHIPLRCNEVEMPEDVKKRKHIEDQMTEALVRTCYKCNMKFVKEDGCNKMTCPCGAVMCYVCKQPVKDYNHFNGDGGDKYHLCPLFSNTDELHAKNVIDEARKLKDSIDNDGTGKLKFDPIKDIESHYSRRIRKKKKTCLCMDVVNE